MQKKNEGSILKIHVVNPKTGKVVWTEEHPTKELADKAIHELQENNFNTNFFKFTITD